MSLFSRHLDLGPPRPANGWRTIAIGTWVTAKDPSVYGVLELDAGPALAFVEKLGTKIGQRVTITHLFGKVMAESLRRHPAINAILRFGRIYPRRSVTLFFQVATDEAGEDLSGLTVHHAETKSVAAIAREMSGKVGAIRDHTDRSFTFMKQLMKLVPGFLSRFVLDLASFVQFSLNIWSPLLGTPRDALGSVMITNVGSLGLEFAFAPLVPYSRAPMVIAMGAVRDQPGVAFGKLAIVKSLRLCVTFDHRLIDGVHAAKLANTVKSLFEDPETAFGAES